MRTLPQWLTEYGESHRNPVNERLHFVCVPAILLSTIGLLSSIPVPRPWAGLPGLDWATSLGIFVVAWIGQAVGHAIEGRRPSFFKDVQFLLIGPAWLLAAAYRRLGLRY